MRKAPFAFLNRFGSIKVQDNEWHIRKVRTCLVDDEPAVYLYFAKGTADNTLDSVQRELFDFLDERNGYRVAEDANDVFHGIKNLIAEAESDSQMFPASVAFIRGDCGVIEKEERRLLCIGCSLTEIMRALRLRRERAFNERVR